MLLLKIHLIPKGTRDIAKKRKLSVWLSIVVLLYHGKQFTLEETGIVHSDTQVVSLTDKTELISLIPTPVSGSYLVKIHTQLIADG